MSQICYNNKKEMEYPKLIRHIRETLLLSQMELAAELGVSFATINRRENGHHRPTMKDRRLIRDYCLKNRIEIEP